MAQLSTKVRLYCEATARLLILNSGGNIELRDDSDGKGAYIATWSVDGLDKPTDAQIASYDLLEILLKQMLV